MRYSRGDESFSYRSLDVPFAYHFALTPVRIAVYNHKSMTKNQWDLKIGDKLHEKIRSDHWSEWFDRAREGRGWTRTFTHLILQKIKHFINFIHIIKWMKILN
jgi:hypothetical protein